MLGTNEKEMIEKIAVYEQTIWSHIGNPDVPYEVRKDLAWLMAEWSDDPEFTWNDYLNEWCGGLYD